MINPNSSHSNNIRQKLSRFNELDENIKAILEEVKKKYITYLKSANWAAVSEGDVSYAVSALEKYVNFVKEVEKQDKFFNWRSDFAGSVIPEFIYRIIKCRLKKLNITHFFSTRDSVVEITLHGTGDDAWNIRRKNQDLCLGTAKCTVLLGGVEEKFVVPTIIFEVKTNIDKNKLNGLEFSAERSKKTFSTSKYFLITETVDFSLKDNYSAGPLDEIYCLRKQLRSGSRKEKQPLQADVFKNLLDDIAKIMLSSSISKGHVYDRLDSGKLINV